MFLGTSSLTRLWKTLLFHIHVRSSAHSFPRIWRFEDIKVLTYNIMLIHNTGQSFVVQNEKQIENKRLQCTLCTVSFRAWEWVCISKLQSQFIINKSGENQGNKESKWLNYLLIYYNQFHFVRLLNHQC